MKNNQNNPHQLEDTQRDRIARNKMVSNQIINRGIKDEKVIEAMREIPRHFFVPPALREYSYDDGPLAIGKKQTISQPYIVGMMTELLQLKKTDKVLEIGTGSGYQCALLAYIAEHVVSVELIEELYERANELLIKVLKMDNLTLILGNGAMGYPKEAPYDAIIATAGAKKTPQTFFDQLKDGGRMVVPEGDRLYQTLNLYTKINGQIHKQPKGGCVFVPFVGAE